jgi:ABC-type branched-subunit amino acid transport system substrate-binding protein
MPWALVVLLAMPGAVHAAPPRPVVLAVVGRATDAGRLQAAVFGARLAARAAPRRGRLEGGVRVVRVDDGGSPASCREALRGLRAQHPVGVLALPCGDLEETYWKAARRLRVVWTTLSGRAPDPARAPGWVLHLGPTPVAQGIVAADAALAPLAARRVACVCEPTRLGTELSAAFARNLGTGLTLAGVRTWNDGDGQEALQGLRALEAGWIYVAMAGAHVRSFVDVLAASTWRPRLLFADGARDASLLERARGCLDGCVFLGGPDPELHGREGEALVDAVDRAGAPMECVLPRAYEAARRLLAAVVEADATRASDVLAAYRPGEARPGVLGPLRFAGHGSVRLFPFRFWRVVKGRTEPWPGGLLPTPGCGPPIGFATPPTARLGDRGRLGYLTWGPPEKRTIGKDLQLLGLSTGGRDPDLDRRVRREILGRTIRIANRLFRREADGTPIPGWSWGMAFTIAEPGEDVKRSRVWPAVCAGDNEAAGGQAFGTWVAVYTSFLRRTMYAKRKLDPPLGPGDRRFLEGRYKWGTDRAANFRADKIRCLMDGFASAMGLTLSHEFGHLCGCGHDTQAPTSIMNVVAGAGANWEDAVWIPAHQHNLTKILGIETGKEGR